MENVTLSNGMELPCVGFGTYKITGGRTAEVVRQAIEVGYRSLDTASYYGTEADIARGIRESGIDRRELRLTSKLWKTEMGRENARAALERSLNRLETDYLDLYLIHWPRPDLENPDWQTLDLETWQTLEEAYRAGRVRAIGVSNFLPHHLLPLLEHCTIRPMVNQLEFHPGYSQSAAVSFSQSQGLLVQAWSPMGRTRVLEEPLLVELSRKYGVSGAQLCLRYALQRGVMPLPKSSAPERMRQNLDIFDFTISREDLFRLETMPQTGWSGGHPDY